MGLVAALVQTIALWRWLAPIGYDVNPQGVQMRLFSRERRLPWKSIGMAETGDRGVYLAPANLETHGLGDWFWRQRGWHLPWGRHREAVLACIRFYLAPSQRRD